MQCRWRRRCLMRIFRRGGGDKRIEGNAEEVLRDVWTGGVLASRMPGDGKMHRLVIKGFT